MRVVVGTLALAQPGGTETYVLTVAAELRRLGHEPVLWAEERGPVADEAERRGLAVARGWEELPERADAVLANDGVSAARLAARYPGTRVVFVAHSDRYDVQLPPLAPGTVSAVVVLCERFAKRVRALALDAPLVRLTQPIDSEHFGDAGPVRDRPVLAVLLGNGLHGARRAALVETWEAAGVRCVQIGSDGRSMVDPRPAIAEADVVVARGRAALEGMASARAVYLYDAFGGDGWMTPETYPAMEGDGFGGLSTTDVADRAALARDLSAYDPDMGWRNRELVVARHGARRHAAELVEVLRGDAPAAVPAGGALAEIARLTRVAWDAERRSLRLERDLAGTHARALAAEARAEAAERRLDEALRARRVQAAIGAGRIAERLRRRR